MADILIGKKLHVGGIIHLPFISITNWFLS